MIASLLVVAVASAAAALPTPEPRSAGSRPVASAAQTVEIGRSVRGRPIRARRLASARARVRVLVVGAIHGNEPAGRAVTRRLRGWRPPRGVALWLVDDLNPDGTAAATRQNTRGVDLNRNFPHRWKAMGAPFDTYHSGSAPLSEPESEAQAALIRRLRPRVTIYYHQMMNLVDRGGGDRFLERRYARRSGLRYGAIPPPPGAATVWQTEAFPRDTAFVVELPAGSLSRASTARHAGAVRAVTGAVAPRSVR